MSRPGLKARGAAMSATALLIGSVVVAVNHPAASATATLNIVGQAGSGAFGTDVTVLSNGNFVVVDSVFDSATQPDVGAVYLYNGATNALISRVTGSTAGDSLGDGGLTEVGSSDFVVRTTSWDNVAVVDAGAVTWVDGTAGLNGQVSSANSLVGTTAADTVGDGGVTALSNGNYVGAQHGLGQRSCRRRGCGDVGQWNGRGEGPGHSGEQPGRYHGPRRCRGGWCDCTAHQRQLCRR